MKETNSNELLKDKRVIEEINRHRWIESEKAGFDVGFEKASIDWLENFSKAWMDYHMPNRKSPSQTSSIKNLSQHPRTKRKKN
jgi:hypothetical protein